LTDQGFQPIPSLFTVEPNRLILNRATPEAAGTYQVVVSNSQGVDRQELRINVEPRRGRGRGQQAGAPQVRFSQSQYQIGQGEVIDIVPNIYVRTKKKLSLKYQIDYSKFREQVEQQSLGQKMVQHIYLMV
jgi:hypothetical protein